MEAKVCKFCAGERLDEVVDVLRKAGYEVSVEGCIGLCAKYDCGRINVIAGGLEISASDMEELRAHLGTTGVGG
ncbi:hypothetical protein E3E38_10005 [Thermococcus sp. 18S1]|uniref:hypothetical protein n=1 Tax=Thermococcus sp. 18S1 TaxID=1638210 RepID=UPI00143C1675|nr:hypothetical protein [Thermococcus sp. 18S1]NJE31374.1 hypothetical protein [Thermococcus sp. 18S1]